MEDARKFKVEQCRCCGRYTKGAVSLGPGQSIHFDCWNEHHSDPTTEWPVGHRCFVDIREDADRKARERDMVAIFREGGLYQPAEHCPGCGRWAHVVAGNDTHPGYYWMTTDCAKCGRYKVSGGPLAWRAYHGREITVEKLGEA